MKRRSRSRRDPVVRGRLSASAVAALAVAALAVALIPFPAQLFADKPDDAPAYEQRAATRDGIGKFYMGREIARVMGHEGADWLERPERMREEQPQKLLKLM